MDEEWTHVPRGGKKRGARRQPASASEKATAASTLLSDVPFVQLPVETVQQKVASLLNRMKEGGWFEQVATVLDGSLLRLSKANLQPEQQQQQQLLKVDEIICYGLGSVCSSSVSRSQFAAAILIRDYLSELNKNGTIKNRENPSSQQTGGVKEGESVVEKAAPPAAASSNDNNDNNNNSVTLSVFDPVMSANDIGVMHLFNCKPLIENDRGNRAASGSGITVFYMPHCGRALYDSVLRANWGDQLSHIVVIGNSFSAYTTMVSNKKIRDDCCCLRALAGNTVEAPLPTLKDKCRAFNDTAVHSFFAGLSSSSWPQIPPPLPLDALADEVM